MHSYALSSTFPRLVPTVDSRFSDPCDLASTHGHRLGIRIDGINRCTTSMPIQALQCPYFMVPIIFMIYRPLPILHIIHSFMNLLPCLIIPYHVLVMPYHVLILVSFMTLHK